MNVIPKRVMLTILDIYIPIQTLRILVEIILKINIIYFSGSFC